MVWSRRCPPRRVDSFRGYENPNQRYGFSPKLILVGHVSGAFNGRPWSLVANETDIVVKLAGLSSLLVATRAVKMLIPKLSFGLAD